MSRISLLPAMIVFGLLTPSSATLAWADTVQLSRGGHLSGTIRRSPDFVIVEVDDDVHVAVRDGRVRSVVTSDQLLKYRQMAQAAGEDAERHYRLAIWCVTGDNVPGKSQQYKRFHMQRAIALDPDHVHARAALGYKKNDGKWILTSKLMRDRGMVMRGGHWEPAEAVAIEDVQDATNVDVKTWIREVNRLTAVVLRNKSAKSQESLEKLKGITDPKAAAAIARQLKESREKGTQSRALRMVWIKLLARFRDSVSIEALVRAGLEEKDELIREAALDQLQEFGASSAVATYLPYLKSSDNRLVNRAARALSWFPDPELALTYVDALVTEHKQVMQAGPGMQAGFTGDGGGGLSTGSKPIVKTHVLENPAVLSLLRSIEPDANHGYNEKAWRMHFAGKRTAFSGDLRRDP